MCFLGDFFVEIQLSEKSLSHQKILHLFVLFQKLINVFPLTDLLLFFLLFFMENWAGNNLPSPADISKIDSMTIQGAWVVLLASIIGTVCFFCVPRKQAEENRDLYSKMTKYLTIAGTFVSGFAMCVMCCMASLKLGNYYITGPNSTMVALSPVIVLFGCGYLLFGSLFFPIRYLMKKNDMKEVHPVIRCLLLIPVMFFSTSFMNDAGEIVLQLKHFATLNAGLAFLGFQFFCFVCVYIGPRFFASGDVLTKKAIPILLIRFCLFFAVLLK